MSEQKSKLKLDGITGFSFSFTSALLEKLKQLKKEDRIFETGEEKAKKSYHKSLTFIAHTVIEYLSEQLKVSPMSPNTHTDYIETLFALAEEFLLAFRK